MELRILSIPLKWEHMLFSDCLKKAKVKDSSDTERIYLALQGYNYGSGYIEWAIHNFGGYSKYNA